MSRLALRSAVALVATAALIVLSAGPASAVDPGDGAVIFNPDGTPIGSELLYDGGTTPQYVYTSETEDDDFWGLDASNIPANDDGDFDSLDAAIPLGFSITVSGIAYDGVLVNSNGGICLVSSTDITSQGSMDQCDGFYAEMMGSVFDPDYTGGPDNYAAFFPFNLDLYPPDSNTPVDTDADTIPDACTFGAYLFEFETNYYCSSVFWGMTTYEGKNAFAATWYHDPSYSADTEEFFNTFQVLLVDNGSGNVTVVYNYDEINNDGLDLDYLGGSPSDIEVEEACGVAWDGGAGDTSSYYMMGMGGVNFTDASATYLDLFGPACANGNNPRTVAELATGGTYELASHNLNSTVPGRYIFAVIDGQPTLTLPAVVPPAVPAGAELAATGTSPVGVVGGAIGMLLIGAFILLGVARRRRHANT